MAEREKLTIPGEPRLSHRIREAAGRDALGHAVVLSGQGDLTAAARFLAAALQCRGADKPSGASVLPNEGRRKVYIFPDCSLLDGKAQNVLLKVVEDGPSHAAFLFCAANSASLLPTIRSRTTEWKLSPPPAAEPGERARELCQAVCSRKAAELAAFCAELENSKITREELKSLLSDSRDLFVSALAAAYTGQGDALAVRLSGEMGKYRLSAVVESLGGFIRQCNYNVGVGQLLGALAVELIR